jgi:glycosyltransferase involved in cell wall biosynthesis
MIPNAVAEPLISVIIPVHGRVNFLPQAIESVLAQTYEQVQVIVVDDGSTVDPAPVVSAFAGRVELVRKSNGGLASARNFGIRHARGEQLLFLDDDDFLEPTALEYLLAALRSAPGAVWAAGRFSYVDQQGRRSMHEHSHRFESGDIYRRMIHHNLMGVPSTVLASAATIREQGGFDETPCYHMAEDYDLWLTLARHSPVAATSAKVSNYRTHDQQFTQRQKSKLDAAVFAVLAKQCALAPGGFEEDFKHSIARRHLECGDDRYWHGNHAEARRHWRQALAGDKGATPWAFASRVAKSYLPASVVRGLRRSKRWIALQALGT